MKASLIRVGACAVGLLLVTGLVSGCTAARVENVLTLPQAQSLLLTNGDDQALRSLSAQADDQVQPKTRTVAENLASVAKDMPAFNPGKCADSAVGLALQSRDTSSGDTLYTGARLLFGRDAGTMYMTSQDVRLFSSVESAQEFMVADKKALADCAEFTVAAEAGPTRVRLVVTDGQFKSEAFGVKVTATPATGAGYVQQQWYLRSGNAIVDLTGSADTDAQAKAISDLAGIMDTRLAGKFNDSGQAQQSATEACVILTASGALDGNVIWDAIQHRVSDTNMQALHATASSFATAAARVTNPAVKAKADSLATSLNALVKTTDEYWASPPSGVDPGTALLETYNAVGSAKQELGCMGEGWTMG